jgi:4-amino-4-deoxy-L-arabinose transferase-like glycosyltransferase
MEFAAHGASPAQCGPAGPAKAGGLTLWLAPYSERRVVCSLAALAGLIRLYLVASSFCISGDGVAYLAMAREFHAGHFHRALAWVFSPLYPWLVGLLYYVLPNWELAGELLSAVLGTAGVVLLYYLMREVYERRGVAAGAAALAAIHPMLAGFAASVRTEAGYITLLTAALLLVVQTGRRRSLKLAALAGLVCGLAYLYRTEGVGVPAAAAAMLVGGAILWRRWTLGWGVGAAALLAAVFMLIASPYMIWLREYTGHWTVGRELGVATMIETGSTMGKLQQWRQLGFRRRTSWFTAIRMDPTAYLDKVRNDFFGSCYAFVQAIGPVLFAALLVGLWVGGRKIFTRWEEATLAFVVLMYFTGFVLTETGSRLMMHIAPLALGRVTIGFEECAQWIDERLRRFHIALPQGISAGPVLAAAVALALLPRTLFPLGYDQRGMRYAGHEIARHEGGSATVAGTDERTAFYAGARFVRLPVRPPAGGDLCGWLAEHRSANYLMIDDREERRWGGTGGSRCLSLIKRYPRVGSTYYDLFAVRQRPSAAPGRGASRRNSDEGRPAKDAP